MCCRGDVNFSNNSNQGTQQYTATAPLLPPPRQHCRTKTPARCTSAFGAAATVAATTKAQALGAHAFAAAAAVAVPETGAGEAGSSTAVVLEPSPREARSTEGSECHGDREPPPRCGDGCGCAPVQADGLTKEDGVPGTVQTASTETPASHQEYDLGTGGKHKPKAQSEASWRMVSFRDEGSCWKLAAVAALLAAVAVCARTRVHVRR